MIGEDRFPALDQAGRDRLGANVHQTPLGKLKVFQLDVAPVDGIQNVLRPRNQQPDYGAMFLRDRVDDPFRLDPFQQHRFAAHQKTAEPVHFCTRMVQRRDAEERVLPGLLVVILFHRAGMDKAAVTVHDRFRETCRAGGEVDRRVIVVGERNGGRFAGTVGDQTGIGFRKGWAIFANIQQCFDPGQTVADGFHPAGELRTEDQHFHVRQIQTVFDLLRRITEVQRHRHGSAFENTEVDGQPFQTIHQEDPHFRAALDVAGQQKVRHPVRFAVKFTPGDLRAEAVRGAGFDKGIFTPGGVTFLQFLRVDLDQRNVLTELLRIPFQNFCNRHVRYLKNLSVFYNVVFSDPFNIQQQSRISSKYMKKSTAERQTPEEDAAVPPRQRRLAPQRKAAEPALRGAAR